MIQQPTLPRSFRWTGGGSAFAGALMVLSALSLFAMWASFGSEQLELLESAGATSDLNVLLLRYSLEVAFVEAGTGTLLIVAGVCFLRRKPWARSALEIISWLTLLYTLLTGPFFVRSLVDLFSLLQTRGLLVGVLVGIVLIAFQVVLLWLFIRYLRSEAVRKVFNPDARNQKPA